MQSSKLLFAAFFLAGFIPIAIRPLFEASRLIVYLEFLVPFALVVAAGIAPHSKGNILLERHPLIWVAFAFSVLSGLVGLAFEWLPRDIIADVARYLAPILAFSIAARVFQSSVAIDDDVMRFLRISVALVAISFGIKAYSVIFQGGSLVQYGVLHLRQDFVAPILLALVGRSLSVQWRLALLLMILGILLSPVLAASKTNTIIALAWLLLFLVAWNVPVILRAFLFVVALGLGLSLQAMVTEDSLFVMGRLVDSVIALVDLDSGYVGKDMSTLGRVAEAESALETMAEFMPISALVGMGSGALWTPVGGISFEGLHDSNFRSLGGGHHIHLTWVAVLFRYGIIGIIIYGYFFNILLRRLIDSKFQGNSIDCRAFRWAFFSLISLNFLGSQFTYFIYGSVDFGIVAGLLYVAISRYSNQSQAL